MANLVTVNSKPNCPYCVQAKAWLEMKKIPYQVVDHPDDDLRLKFYEELSVKFGRPVRTMPAIILTMDGDDTLIGGFEDLKKSGLTAEALE